MTSKTSSLKRRIYGNYSYLSDSQYHWFIFISISDEIFLIALIYGILIFIHGKLTFINKLEIYTPICVLLLFLILCVIVTIDLFMYPRLYKKDEQPICCYSYGNKNKYGIIIDMVKGKVLVRSIKDSYNDLHLRLISLNDIKYIHKFSLDKSNDEPHKCKLKKNQKYN